MSQSYHIELRQAVSRVVTAEDALAYPIEMTEILPADEMRELLREALVEAGWEASAEGDAILTAAGPSGEQLAVDLESGELTAALAVEREVVGEVSADGRGTSSQSARRNARKRLRERASAMAGELEQAGRRSLRKQVTERLEQGEEARRRLLNELLQRVYAEALKRKAGQLGEILEVRESTDESGSYELLIRVAQ